MLKKLALLFCTFFAAAASAASGTALVVGPGLGTENYMNTKLAAAGYTVTVSTSGIPSGSLSNYKQIWDVRFQNQLTSSEISNYVAYLQGGGSLFLLGEGTQVPLRNSSIFDVVIAAGGQVTSSGFTLANNNQTVNAPFNSNKNTISTVTYAYCGGIPIGDIGSATAITQDSANLATALRWGPGTMTSATSGTLITVFDVNPIYTGTDQPLFIENLIEYLAAPSGAPTTPAAVPTLGEWGMIFLASLLAMFGIRRMRRQ